MAANGKRPSSRKYAVLMTLLVVAIYGGGTALALANCGLSSWCLNVVATLFFLAGTGNIIVGRPDGILIDSRNVISLARLQMTAWTVLVLSALYTAAMMNAATNVSEALNIELPEQLLWLMGISTTSLAGSALILSTKKGEDPNTGEMDHTFELVNDNSKRDAGALTNQGQLVANMSPSQARWIDLFTGEEIGNYAQIDLSRVQMFFITILVLIAYSAMLGSNLHHYDGHDLIKQFPALSGQLVGLIGISHGGYLVIKAVPHSQGPDDAANNPGRTAAAAEQPPLG
ncbi:hypothetical protein [Silvimonas iriomotensis]|uniref:Uncharacterized protein n=1 Tax=Silvimonas iriomotensis TaxID=449662 RepID=A0ABQ2P864_9NEIS|nr:hypothetical protein [Silvimonas iriomotensis]GGP20558.1 hypothetical protein GCM10010970_15810 [Silvimonas iriomotensis]